jgi:hypothetical protein
MAPAAAQEAQCFTADSLIVGLQKDGYEAAFIGVDPQGFATIMLSNTEGKWVAIMLTPDGAGCIVGKGHASEIIRGKPNV